MYTTNLRRIDGSVMVAVPSVILDQLRLRVGEKIGLSVDGGHLVLDPHPRPRYSLDELLAECDSTAEPNSEDRHWLDSGPVGRELL
uniref:Antitoxin ChpS n=1 Tax=Candidatus Kentrum sp. FM TaxID=2126340 RepID=A0A450W7X8_9GAMM|nr:MAG: antitoxin ChpS [Candidatus Kentron sp. FM]VFJ60891.1 MAG: antitoxin ChpS [Candidatus Kentron sp. FM]VFK13139.1 MAG: antitoxin ChpS [Candidatus Kentron sp. FM]